MTKETIRLVEVKHEDAIAYAKSKNGYWPVAKIVQKAVRRWIKEHHPVLVAELEKLISKELRNTYRSLV